jgi:hypothetical protein
MDVGEIITAAKDSLLGIAAAITAIVAILGLRKWREELRGRADFEVARALIRATYKLRDELELARSPFVRASEFPPNYKGAGNHTPKEEADAWWHVYKSRWEPVGKALQELQAQVLEAEALWGSEARTKGEAIRTCAHNVFVAFQTIVENAASGGRDFESDREFARKVRAEASSASAKDNPLNERITKAVEGLEEITRKHLKRR